MPNDCVWWKTDVVDQQWNSYQSEHRQILLVSGEYCPPHTFCDAARKARQLSAMIACGSPLLTIETRAATRQLLLTGASDPLSPLLLPLGDDLECLVGPAGFPVSAATITTRWAPYATARSASCSAWLKDLAAVKHLRGGRKRGRA